MKHYILLVFLFCVSTAAFPKENGEKTFLTLFNKTELKKINSSTAYIELNFLKKFQTKSYTGNSDAALLITIPSGDMDKCRMGEMLVQINHSTWVPLEEIALRIIDLNESKESYRALLSMIEGNHLEKEKQLVRLKL